MLRTAETATDRVFGYRIVSFILDIMRGFKIAPPFRLQLLPGDVTLDRVGMQLLVMCRVPS